MESRTSLKPKRDKIFIERSKKKSAGLTHFKVRSIMAEPPVLPQQREAKPFGERDPRRPHLSVHFGTEKS